MSRVLKLFPAEWRDRHGDEVLEALEHSHRPVRDRFDLFVTATRLASERNPTVQTSRARRLLVVLAVCSALLGSVTLAWAATSLNDGLAEVPHHWWSVAAALPLALAVTLAVPVAVLPSRRRSR